MDQKFHWKTSHVTNGRSETSLEPEKHPIKKNKIINLSPIFNKVSFLLSKFFYSFWNSHVEILPLATGLPSE